MVRDTLDSFFRVVGLCGRLPRAGVSNQANCAIVEFAVQAVPVALLLACLRYFEGGVILLCLRCGFCESRANAPSLLTHVRSWLVGCEGGGVVELGTCNLL